jgi:hypothetical protein
MAFTNPMGLQVPISEYPSIDMLCIVVTVKFENVLSISVLRKKLLFPKIWGSNFQIFKNRRRVKHWALKSILGNETAQKPLKINA